MAPDEKLSLLPACVALNTIFPRLISCALSFGSSKTPLKEIKSDFSSLLLFATVRFCVEPLNVAVTALPLRALTFTTRVAPLG